MNARDPAGPGTGQVIDRKPLVSVIIPTLNEAQNLPHILPFVPSEYEVVIVDGCSIDDTLAVASMLRPDAILVRQPRCGKADALFAGFAAASGDFLVTLDADGSHRVSELPLFVAALEEGADFVKGSRVIEGGGSVDFTRIRAAGNRALATAASALHGTHISDLTYGYNAFRRDAVPHLATGADGFEGEVIMCVRAARAGLRLVEVPCYEDRRIFGQSNLRTFRDGWRILWMLVQQRRKALEPAAAEPRIG